MLILTEVVLWWSAMEGWNGGFWHWQVCGLEKYIVLLLVCIFISAIKELSHPLQAGFRALLVPYL